MKGPLPKAALDQLFGQARTYNAYLDNPVGEAHLHTIWTLMRMGPTSYNMLPARLVWCMSPSAKAKLATLASGSNGRKILAAPVSVIIGMDLDFHERLPELFPHSPAVRGYFSDIEIRREAALRNSSLQGGYFIMAARAMGLDTGPMSGFDNAAVDCAFFADTPRVKSNFISTVGYGDPKSLTTRPPRPAFEVCNRVE